MSRFNIKAPDVHIENLRITPQPIEGVSTSTAAFVGETQTGPTTPTSVTSWAQFKTVFDGNFGADKFLPYAVEGFFSNGGQKCCICRVTDGNFTAALAKLETINDISLLYSPNAQAIPGLSDAMISHCERLRNRFAIFDSLKSQPPSSITKPRDSAYAALYYPWIYVKPEGSTQTVLIPPGGHIAGVYARSDNERGVQKAPPTKSSKELSI